MRSQSKRKARWCVFHHHVREIFQCGDKKQVEKFWWLSSLSTNDAQLFKRWCLVSFLSDFLSGAICMTLFVWCLLWFFFFFLFFLVACTWLYTPLCQLVGRSVCLSVGHTLLFFYQFYSFYFLKLFNVISGWPKSV